MHACNIQTRNACSEVYNYTGILYLDFAKRSIKCLPVFGAFLHISSDGMLLHVPLSLQVLLLVSFGNSPPSH